MGRAEDRRDASCGGGSPERFSNSDAYRYNSASIRVRVLDDSFKDKSNEERADLVEPLLEELPESTQRDIVNLLMLTIDETKSSLAKSLANEEFEEPSRSTL